MALFDRHALDRPDQSQTQSQSAWLNDTRNFAKSPAPPARTSSNKTYMDEMLEGHGIEGKEFHASLFPKVRSHHPIYAALVLMTPELV
jgi:hypothetical protein